ncbi:MAG TPA: hypothetical protein VFV76_13535, partial [Actinomycetes bacterium]|nr:hypothetical protein [Actinomycetes bacterium]
RVALRWAADGELAEALREHSGLIATEVLATQFDEGAPEPGLTAYEDRDLGLRFALTRTEQ